MRANKGEFKKRLADLAASWTETKQSLPSHTALESMGADLAGWKQANNVTGLWMQAPVMITATIDDSLGQGLRIINLYAGIAGLEVIPLGLMQPPETIIAACNREQPDMLGMTVLQFDSEEDLIRIRRNIPSATKMIAGGPVFGADPEFAERIGIDFVAKNVAVFLRYLLSIS